MAGKRPSGMGAFTVVWFGQVISMMGSGMTQFALTFWAYQISGQATALALMGLFSFGPAVLMGPLAGVLVDRWNRKLVMMLSDLGTGLATVALLLLQLSGGLELWHLYAAAAFAGVFQSFQWPAYSAAISTMLSKEQYGRANGMISMADSGSGILAPMLAGALLPLLGVSGILAIDVVTFVFAIGSLLFVHIPQPRRTEAGQQGKGSLLQEARYGFTYIRARPGLLGLQMVFFFTNFFGSLGQSVMPAMILGRTGNSATTFGLVQSAGAIGGVAGGLLMSVWGGPQRRVYGVLFGMMLFGLLSDLPLGIGRSLPIWAFGAFSAGFFVTILNGSNQALWQAKVAPDVQGRVFAIRRLIAQVAGPLGMLIAGPLADRVMEPAMRPGGAMAPVFGGLVGTGPGAGIALVFVAVGLLNALVALTAYSLPFIRNVETQLPDHDAAHTA